MTDTNVAPDGGGEAPAIVITPADTSKTFHSFSEAAKALSEARWQKHRERAASSEGAVPAATIDTAPDEQISPEGDNAAPRSEVPGETLDAEPEADTLPTIEPPRSWTKEARERFATLPRDTQEYISSREQERDRELRRLQNDAAEQRKAIDADRRAAEQARQQYEQQLPALMQALHDQQAGQFADIKSIDDVNRLAQEDPFRYLQWDAHQKRLAAVNLEMRSAQDRQVKELEAQWANYIQSENALVAERIPELADAKKAADLTAKAVDTLRDIGFTDQELGELASGRKAIPIYDHRLQLLILDGVKYREAKKSAATVAPKPAPPVQRPGSSPSKAEAASETLQALKVKLEQTGDIRAATALYAAQRASRR